MFFAVINEVGAVVYRNLRRSYFKSVYRFGSQIYVGRTFAAEVNVCREQINSGIFCDFGCRRYRRRIVAVRASVYAERQRSGTAVYSVYQGLNGRFYRFVIAVFCVISVRYLRFVDFGSQTVFVSVINDGFAVRCFDTAVIPLYVGGVKFDGGDSES